MEEFLLLEGGVTLHGRVLFSLFKLHEEENEKLKENAIAFGLDFKFKYFACEWLWPYQVSYVLPIPGLTSNITCFKHHN